METERVVMEIATLDDEKEASPVSHESLSGIADSRLHLLSDVPVNLSIELGGTQILVRDLIRLRKGSVIELDRAVGELADILINGKRVARGEVVVVDDRLGIRLVEIKE